MATHNNYCAQMVALLLGCLIAVTAARQAPEISTGDTAPSEAEKETGLNVNATSDYLDSLRTAADPSDSMRSASGGLPRLGYLAEVAAGKPTKQSSKSNDGEPSRAVDGNPSMDWDSRSCTHTTQWGPGGGTNNPWWRVDLGSTMSVIYVTVFNRINCCEDRINGARIMVSDKDDVNAAKVCATISASKSNPFIIGSFPCAKTGRYVFIQIPGSGKILTLCEVKVYANFPEVAAGKPTKQSSTYSNGEPSRAVDGNKAMNWNSWSCTHTSQTNDPWWRVDLMERTNVNQVTVFNRVNCCEDRIDGARIMLADKDDVKSAKVCATISASKSSPFVYNTFPCDGTGRYVFIQIPGSGKFLTLCEVKVYGVPA